MDATTYINLVLVLIGFITLFYNKRQAVINDAPRLVVKKTNINVRPEKPTVISCELTNAGNGVALQTFLLVRIKDYQDFSIEAHLSKPTNLIYPREKTDRRIEVSIDRFINMDNIDAYVISIDFFKNIHVSKMGFSRNNEHLMKLMEPVKAISKYNPIYSTYNEWIKQAVEQENTYAHLHKKKQKKILDDLEKRLGKDLDIRK